MFWRPAIASVTALFFFVLGSVAAGAHMSAARGDVDTMSAYAAAMNRMEKKMMAATDSDPGKAYLKKMIAHHQGAIDMSEIVLRQATEPFVRETAQRQIEMQRKDIEELNGWLARH